MSNSRIIRAPLTIGLLLNIGACSRSIPEESSEGERTPRRAEQLSVPSSMQEIPVAPRADCPGNAESRAADFPGLNPASKAVPRTGQYTLNSSPTSLHESPKTVGPLTFADVFSTIRGSKASFHECYAPMSEHDPCQREFVVSFEISKTGEPLRPRVEKADKEIPLDAQTCVLDKLKLLRFAKKPSPTSARFAFIVEGKRSIIP
jgi:hypothetical protein